MWSTRRRDSQVISNPRLGNVKCMGSLSDRSILDSLAIQRTQRKLLCTLRPNTPSDTALFGPLASASEQRIAPCYTAPPSAPTCIAVVLQPVLALQPACSTVPSEIKPESTLSLSSHISICLYEAVEEGERVRD